MSSWDPRTPREAWEAWLEIRVGDNWPADETDYCLANPVWVRPGRRPEASGSWVRAAWLDRIREIPAFVVPDKDWRPG